MPPTRSYSDLQLDIRRFPEYSWYVGGGSSAAHSSAISTPSTTLTHGRSMSASSQDIVICTGRASEPSPACSLDMASSGGGDECARERIERLEEQLRDARLAIKDRDEKVSRLSSIQNTVDSEVQELTEKLFQEAYKMVNIAEERRERAEKLQKESRLQVDVLQAEVDALKLLVSSCGAGFNHHQNTSPLRQHRAMQAMHSTSTSPFARFFHNAKHGRFQSHSPLPHSPTFPSSNNGAVKSNGTNAENGRHSFIKQKSTSLPSTSNREGKERTVSEEQKKADEVEEIDPQLYREFTAWRDASHPLQVSVTNAFMARIEREDVQQCLSFDNIELAASVLSAIRGRTIEIEPVNEEKATVQTCSLTCVPRFCPYRIRCSPDGSWYRVSLLARNRIAAVCDFFTYARYLSEGMLKNHGIRDSYFDIIALRKNMSLARLGLGFVPRTTLSRPECGFN